MGQGATPKKRGKKERSPAVSRLRTVCKVLLWLASGAVAFALVSEWIDETSLASTRAETRQADSLTPPLIGIWANPFSLGTCGIRKVVCTFSSDYELTLGTAFGMMDNGVGEQEVLKFIGRTTMAAAQGEIQGTDCTDFVRLWQLNCKSPLGCTAAEICPDGSEDCEFSRTAVWVFNSTAAAAAGVTVFRSLQDQLLLQVTFVDWEKCVPGPQGVLAPFVSLYALPSEEWQTSMWSQWISATEGGNVSELYAAVGSLLAVFGVPQYLGLNHSATSEFSYYEEHFLNDTVKHGLELGLTQAQMTLNCADRPIGAKLSECKPDVDLCKDPMYLAACMDSCGVCKFMQFPSQTIFLLRPRSFDILVTKWSPGQSAFELLGVIFGWVGIFTGYSLLSMHTAMEKVFCDAESSGSESEAEAAAGGAAPAPPLDPAEPTPPAAPLPSTPPVRQQQQPGPLQSFTDGVLPPACRVQPLQSGNSTVGRAGRPGSPQHRGYDSPDRRSRLASSGAKSPGARAPGSFRDADQHASDLRALSAQLAGEVVAGSVRPPHRAGTRDPVRSLGGVGSWAQGQI